MRLLSIRLIVSLIVGITLVSLSSSYYEAFKEEGLALFSGKARQAGIQGQVVLQAEISKEGTIQNLQLISGDPILAVAAIDAVKKWEYNPYRYQGKPVAMETQVIVDFKLQ